MVSAAALGAPDIVSATDLLPAPWAAAESANLLVPDQAPIPTESETPFDEAEQTSDPTESSKGGEERPESSDAETIFVDTRSVTLLMAPDAIPSHHVSLPPLSAVALVSQFHPDGLERPPRA